MKTLIKIFVVLLVLIFIVPMLWFLLKELWWLFGISLSGLFGGCCVIGDGFGWFLLTIVFIIIIIWILSNWN
jgi:hypothetical protein